MPSRFLPAACSVVLIVIALAGSQPKVRAADDMSLRAGAAVADITPQNWPQPMTGSFERRDAVRAWDALSARALVLDNGSVRLGIVIVDNCLCPRSLFDEAKRRASELTDIRTDHLLMAATHTHSAPAVKGSRDWEPDAAYVEHMTRGIVSALQQATANLAPCELGYGSADVPEEVFNRRWFMNAGGIVPNPFGEITEQVRMNPPRNADLLDRPAGPVDPQVSFLSVRTHEGRPIALLANYSLHYVGGIPSGGVSADYFGVFAHEIQKRLLPASHIDTLPPFVGIMSNGTSGDVNNISFREPRPGKPPFEQMHYVANLVADRVAEAMPTVRYHRALPLRMAQAELTLKVRKPTPEQLARADEYLAAENEAELPRLAKHYAWRTKKLAEHAGTEDLVLQAIRIGDVGITSIPCEVFAEIGLSLKEQSPLKSSFTIELANGHYGYLPTPRQHELGGYETWMGTNILEIEASDRIEETLLKLLHEVAAD